MKNSVQMLAQRVIDWLVPPAITMEVLCLANSRKHGGRCLAGVRLDNGIWVRLIGTGTTGAVSARQYLLSDRTEPRPLDTLTVTFSKPVGRPHQPENWCLRSHWYNPWYKPCRASRKSPHNKPSLSLLRLYLAHGSELLGSSSNAIPFADFQKCPASCSLALVQPEKLQWVIKMRFSNRRQIRALFSLGNTIYDLAVTDPLWEESLISKPLGCYSLAEIGIASSDTVLLTLSIGEPFGREQLCYKLVAAVIVVSKQD